MDQAVRIVNIYRPTPLDRHMLHACACACSGMYATKGLLKSQFIEVKYVTCTEVKYVTTEVKYVTNADA